MLQETQLRKWYHVDSGLLDGTVQTSEENELLVETDEEQEVMYQTDSDIASDGESGGDDGILFQSDVENEASEPKNKKRKYLAGRSGSMAMTFLGKPVCKRAHARLYGVSANALQNLREGRAPYTMTGEDRLHEPKHETLRVSLVRSASSKKWPNVLAFFVLLYNSCAEILPTKLTMPSSKGFFESASSSDPDFQERYVNAFMKTLEKNYDLNPVTFNLKLGTISFWLVKTC